MRKHGATDSDVLEVHQLTAQLAARNRTIAELRRENGRLTKRLRAASQRADHTPAQIPTVYSDPQQQFRYEVEQHWLRMLPEADRHRYPLSSYTLGSDWLASLTQQLVDHGKLLDVVVDVLTGRAADHPARQIRRLRAHAGRAPYVVRGDQAIAMRCNVKNQSPSAPRLMWWKFPDNSIELGRIARHDDTQLR